MGTVIKCFREWKISGDDKWLADNWENIKKILAYAWSSENPDAWDRDMDGVLEGRQHHTLDMELFGPSSWLEGMYLLALKAASEMAEYLNDKEACALYTALYEKGCEWTKENLFNGKYFIQNIDLSDKTLVERYGEEALSAYWNYETKQIKYQIGEGSSIDQILAQWHSNIIGLGDIFDKEQRRIAIRSMLSNNYKVSLREFANPWRIFAVNDESACVMCDYPQDAEKPSIPIPYCEEAMTGFEYAFAGLLFSEGYIDDGLRIVKSVRERYDGKKRNPWNEIECGSNYARTMSSFSFVPIFSGFDFHLPKKHIGFNPIVKGDFHSIWSVGTAWGTFSIHDNTAKIKIFDGSILLSTIGLGFANDVNEFKMDGKATEHSFKNNTIHFEEAEISDEIEIVFAK